MDNILIIIIALVSGTATYTIANTLNRGGVFASAIVTLISGIFLPYFFKEIGSTLMVVAACASYAGMISIKNAPKLWDMVMVSVITGGVFIFASSAYQGVGGRLGTIAAIACFAWIGVKKVFYNIKQPIKIEITVK